MREGEERVRGEQGLLWREEDGLAGLDGMNAFVTG